jgi:hypothetical protein
MGLDVDWRIWHYNLVTQAWAQINGGYNNTLREITVGVNDVWGLGSNGTLYRSNPFRGGEFVGVAAGKWIAAGGDGVWGLGLDEDIVHLTSRVPQYQIILNAEPLVTAVGSGGGVWLLDTSSRVYVFIP